MKQRFKAYHRDIMTGAETALGEKFVLIVFFRDRTLNPFRGLIRSFHSTLFPYSLFLGAIQCRLN
jgi:hypothetical protein